MSAEPKGAEVMIELAFNIIETSFPLIIEADKVAVKEVFHDFVYKKQDFELASERIIKLVGNNDALVKIKNIINLPSTPLPEIMYNNKKETFSSSKNVKSSTGSRKKTRTWTTIEDCRLLAGVYHFGSDDWKSVSHFIGNGRNKSQCSQRWIRCLDPHISKKNWSVEENARLKELVKIHGDKSWTKISALMGNRSDVQCRYHYKQIKNECKDELTLTNGQKLSQSTFSFKINKTDFDNKPNAVKSDKHISLNETTCIQSISSSSPNIFKMDSILTLGNTSNCPGLVGKPQEEIDSFLKNFM